CLIGSTRLAKNESSQRIGTAERSMVGRCSDMGSETRSRDIAHRRDLAAAVIVDLESHVVERQQMLILSDREISDRSVVENAINVSDLFDGQAVGDAIEEGKARPK